MFLEGIERDQTIWYHLYNLKNATLHPGFLSCFLVAQNGTKSRKASYVILVSLLMTLQLLHLTFLTLYFVPLLQSTLILKANVHSSYLLF